MKFLLIVYDNGSHIPFFPQGIAYLAAALKQEGVKVELYLQDIYHWSEAHLTDLLNKTYFDFVGLGFVAGYYQYRKALAISKAIKDSNFSGTFVLGGHGPAAAPEYFLEKTGADVVVVGDGEDALKDIVEGDFKKNAWLWRRPRRNPDELPWPDYGSFPVEIYRLHRFPHSGNRDFTMPVLSGRGCPFACTFCYRMDSSFRPRNPENVLEEIAFLGKSWQINHIQFSDELLMSSKQRSVEFSEAIIRSGLKIKWDCNGRLNFATKEVLEVMKRAGCTYINYGIEALDDAVLAKMKKGLTVSQIVNGVEATIAAGITPGLNFMWGNYGDNTRTLREAVKFLTRYDGTAELRTIRPVTPYPGSELFNCGMREGRLGGAADFYDSKHTNSDLFTVSFADGISETEGDALLANANKELVKSYYERCAKKVIDDAMEFYEGKNKDFRGFRPI